jgi:hypothetical protein
MCGIGRAAYRGFDADTLGKETVGKPKCRLKNNIKMDLQEVGWGGRDWYALAQDRDRWRARAYALMNLRAP